MNIHLTEIPHPNPQSHFGTKSPVQNTAIERLSGLLLLLSYLHPHGEGAHVTAFSGFTNARSWRLSLGIFHLFTLEHHEQRQYIIFEATGRTGGDARPGGGATGTARPRKQAGCFGVSRHIETDQLSLQGATSSLRTHNHSFPHGNSNRGPLINHDSQGSLTRSRNEQRRRRILYRAKMSS